MNFLTLLWTMPILQMALLASIGASVAGGIVGSYVVAKRIVSISGSIAHSVLSGVGAVLWLERIYGFTWLSPLHGALISAVLGALVIGYSRIYHQEREDAVIAMVWSFGMATGVIFISQMPGFNIDLMNILIGHVLWVSKQDLIMLGIADLIILITVLIFHKRLLAICFDEKQAELRNLNVSSLYLLLLILVALTVVLLTYIVGIILVLSMLALPASIAGKLTHRLSNMMFIAVTLNIIFSLSGLTISYYLDWPTGGTIALFSTLIYAASLCLRKFSNSPKPSPVKAETEKVGKLG